MELESTPVDGTEQAGSEVQILKLENSLGSGASWFYWIAGLSIINSVSLLLKSDLGFVIGLGTTQVIDAIALVVAEDLGGTGSNIIRSVAFGLDVMAAGVFVLFGWLAHRRHAWAFLIGMAFYALDGAVFLLVQDWLGLGFHVFALFCVFAGYSALHQLNAMSQATTYYQPIELGAA